MVVMVVHMYIIKCGSDVCVLMTFDFRFEAREVTCLALEAERRGVGAEPLADVDGLREASVLGSQSVCPLPLLL